MLHKEQLKKAEATRDLIRNKIDKTTSVSKKSTKELPNDETESGRSSPNDVGKASPKDVPKKRIHISRRKTTNYS